MLQQLSIFDEENSNQQPVFDYVEHVKRLVAKDYMSTIQWRVYNYLTKNCLGKKNRISMMELSNIFTPQSSDGREMREIIKVIKIKQVAKIGTIGGYYIMSVDEYDREVARAKARLETIIEVSQQQFPEIKLWLHARVEEHKGEWIAQGQMQIPHTGYERIFIRQYAEDYERGL